MTDYLTCGQCLREFPLQRITLFIQHKKLDCDDGDDVQLDNPELQCIYCPQGFMTAWGLLVHAQLTHNLKIFLEKASQSLLNQKQKPSLQQHSPLFSGKVFSKQNNNYPVQDADNSVNTEIQPILSNAVHKTERNVSPGSCKQSKSIGIIHSQVHKQSIVTERNIPKEDSNKENHNFAKMGSGIMVTRDTNSGTKHVRERVTADENILEAPSDNTANSISSFASSDISHVGASNAVNVFNQFAQTSTQSISPGEKDLNVINENIETQIPTLSSSVTLVNSSKTPGKVLTLKSLSPQKLLQIGQRRTDSLPTLPNLIKETSDMLVSRTADNMTAKQCTAIYSMSAGEKMGSVTFVELPTLGTDQMDINGIMVNQIQERIESVEKPRDKNENSILTCPAERVDTGRGEEEGPKNATNRENTCFENESLDSAMEECCDNQGCGVTVIPGSHQNLQKCCNAIVPKKRKRHMEMKHMPPFSWSSSRYARRKMLHRSLAASATKSLSSAFLRKVSSGNIYIDLEPESLMVADKPQNSDIQQGAKVDAPQCKADIKSNSPQSLQAENILNETENRTRSLILQPGAVFSIPFTYKIPNSLTGSRFTRIAQAVSVADTTTISQNVTPLTSQVSITSADENPDRVVQMPEYTTIFTKTENESEIGRRKYPTSKPFRCGMCSLSFNQRIHLKKHMSKHTGVKPYKCGECNYSTVERSHLKVHIRIHTGEKPFKCTYCEYATAQNSTLKIHLKRHHGGRMFQCNDCDKKFTQEQQLKGHEWEHGKVIISHDKKKNEADVAAWHTAGDKAIAITKDNSSVIMNTTNQIDDSIHVIPPIPGVSTTNQGKDNGIVSSMESMTNQDRDIGHVISLPEKVDQSDQRVAYYTSLASKLLQGENWSDSGEKR